MLLVALVGLPCVRANLADRVVPEEQFYDDSSEAAFSTKAGDHEQTRDTRVDAEEGKFERIQELLSSLKGSISNEQLQCDSKQQVRPEQRAVRWGCLPCIMRRPMRKRARLRRLHQRFAVCASAAPLTTGVCVRLPAPTTTITNGTFWTSQPGPPGKLARDPRPSTLKRLPNWKQSSRRTPITLHNSTRFATVCPTTHPVELCCRRRVVWRRWWHTAAVSLLNVKQVQMLPTSA